MLKALPGVRVSSRKKTPLRPVRVRAALADEIVDIAEGARSAAGRRTDGCGRDDVRSLYKEKGQ